MARGFTKTFRVDYKETFSHVSKMNTVRVFLSIAMNYNWSMYQMDIKNVFLLRELQEEVYIQIPPGYSQAKKGMACKLHKAIYSLKQ